MPVSLIESGLSERGVHSPTKIIRALIEEHGSHRLAEISKDISRFDKKTSTALHWMGYSVLTLSGRTPGQVLGMGEKGISLYFQNADREILSYPSSLSEVAFFSRETFLPDSSDLTYQQQEKTVEIANIMFKQQFPNLKAKIVIPSVSDWIEAIWINSILGRGRRIFSRKDKFHYAATSTLNFDGSVVDIGGLKRIGCLWSLEINSHKKDQRLTNVHVAPMLVPDNS